MKEVPELPSFLSSPPTMKRFDLVCLLGKPELLSANIASKSESHNIPFMGHLSKENGFGLVRSAQVD